MQLLTSQKKFLVLSICIPKRINGIISEVQLWKKKSFLFLSEIGTGSIFSAFHFHFRTGWKTIVFLSAMFKLISICLFKLTHMARKRNADHTVSFFLFLTLVCTAVNISAVFLQRQKRIVKYYIKKFIKESQ